MRRSWPLLLALGACQPGQLRPSASCIASAPNEVVFKYSSCLEERFGEGRGDDIFFANAHIRGVFRHPQEALTVHGVGGGTLIAGAQWGWNDRLHEAIPIVGDGWIEVIDWEIRDSSLWLAGPIRDLPDRPASDFGAWREVTWTLGPDDRHLGLTGADGLWLHANGEQSRYGAQLYGPLLYGHDGVLEEDLGGAMRLADVSRLTLATPLESLSELGDVLVTGTAIDASTIRFYDEAGIALGSFPIEEGVFEATLPEETTQIRALSPGRSPSPLTPIADEMDVTVGAPGQIQVIPILGDGLQQSVQVAWTDQLGRSGWRQVTSDGGILDVGAGRYTLTVNGGPRWISRSFTTIVEPDEMVVLSVELDPRIDSGRFVLADLDRTADRAWTYRGSNDRLLTLAETQGVTYTVMSALNDVAAPGESGHTVTVDGGSLLLHPDHEIRSFPMVPNEKRAGHGAPHIAPLDAIDGLGAAASMGRRTIANLDWFTTVTAPSSLTKVPDMVQLTSPGSMGPRDGDWKPWFDLLDARKPVVPVGPWTWVGVDDPDLAAKADTKWGLSKGDVVASTGPVIDFELEGVRPGDIYPWSGLALASWTVSGPVDSLAIVGTQGDILYEGPAEAGAVYLHNLESWIVAVAWSQDGSEWATTGPIWLAKP